MSFNPVECWGCGGADDLAVIAVFALFWAVPMALVVFYRQRRPRPGVEKLFSAPEAPRFPGPRPRTR
jgi:hypothetical protein